MCVHLRLSVHVQRGCVFVCVFLCTCVTKVEADEKTGLTKNIITITHYI